MRKLYRGNRVVQRWDVNFFDAPLRDAEKRCRRYALPPHYKYRGVTLERAGRA